MRDLSCGDLRIYLEVEVRRVQCRRDGLVKQEQLDWLSANPHYTKRFAYYVGKRCQGATIKDVAAELHLDWHTVKELEKEYLREKLRRAGEPRPCVIGIDEISVGKRHDYRIVVSDLERHRAIWFGGTDRSAASLDLFFAELGEKQCGKIRLAVMEMWKAFENSTRKKAKQAAILYDKFHVMRHLGKALDQVRRSEYRRVSGKGQPREPKRPFGISGNNSMMANGGWILAKNSTRERKSRAAGPAAG